MGQNKSRKYKTKNRQNQTPQSAGMKITTIPGAKFQQNLNRQEKDKLYQEPVSDKPTIKIDREKIKSTLTDICNRCSTDSISVGFTEDTRKLDAGIVYYIVHIRKPDTRKTPTSKTGIYFTRVKDGIHVQVINGASMILLYSNHSDNSQIEVFNYVENIIRKDMEFYQNALEAKKPRPARKGGNTNYGK